MIGAYREGENWLKARNAEFTAKDAGNNYINVMLDRNGAVYDVYYPSAGCVQGMGTRNEGYVDGNDTWSANDGTPHFLGTRTNALNFDLNRDAIKLFRNTSNRLVLCKHSNYWSDVPIKPHSRALYPLDCHKPISMPLLDFFYPLEGIFAASLGKQKAGKNQQPKDGNHQ